MISNRNETPTWFNSTTNWNDIKHNTEQTNTTPRKGNWSRDTNCREKLIDQHRRLFVCGRGIVNKYNIIDTNMAILLVLCMLPGVLEPLVLPTLRAVLLLLELLVLLPLHILPVSRCAGCTPIRLHATCEMHANSRASRFRRNVRQLATDVICFYLAAIRSTRSTSSIIS
jgi:hypothetical protein